MEQLEGVVESVIYENQENGYTVCDVSSNGKLYTLTGYMPSLCEGERIKASGEWKMHREYGEQFSVSFFERMMPEKEEEIEQYLASGMFPHIGRATARKIVELFGADALSVIENEPMQLTKIKGISEKKADEIYRKYLEQMGMKQLIMFFGRYGVSPNLAVKAYKNFGEAAVSAVSANPFILTGIDGFTFAICDKISRQLSFPPEFPPRVCAGVKSILLNSAYLSGHTFLPFGALTAQAKAFLEVETETVEESVSELILNGELIRESRCDCDAVYLKTFYDAEVNVAKRLREMSGVLYSVDISEANSLIESAEKEQQIILADAQRSAVCAVLENSAVVITGGPGTGKTTIIKTVIDIMKKEKKRIALAAPTGRAAKRMSQVCGVEAKTIHRLLENMPSEGEGVSVFGRNENNKLECDVLIVDEMSMVDILLMNSLLLALPVGARLVMVGDADQLPSVGAGNVLRDIIESDALVTIKLTEIFRQARESMIIVNAHRINSGEMPLCNDYNNDFFMLGTESAEVVSGTIADLCARRLPTTYNIDGISQIQVLTPTRKTAIGTVSLNALLQRKLNPPDIGKAERVGTTFTFRIGDKVMQNKNNYSLEWRKPLTGEKGTGVFNGDVGFVTDINNHKKTLTVTYDDREATYDFLDLDELELAYAITVHKSQGSEFDVVIMPMLETHKLLLSRNLLYTAITRAKKLVILVGSEEILRAFVENNNIRMRFSGLRERLMLLLQG